MSPIDYVKLALSRYADFGGRSRRMEYWMFFLFNLVCVVVAMMLDGLLGLSGMIGPYGPLYAITALGLLVPGIAAAVRRLHDQDKSGWWLLLALVPLAGIVILVFMFLEGTKGPNQYGPDPKGAA